MAEVKLNFKRSGKEYNRLYHQHLKAGTLGDFLLRGKNTGRSKNKEHNNKVALQYWRRNPAKRLHAAAKYRAKKYDLDFDIEESDLEIPEFCLVLGIELKQGGMNSPNSPSLDRIDNNKGYVKGNVRVISHRANTIKSNATQEELEKVLEYVKQYAD